MSRTTQRRQSEPLIDLSEPLRCHVVGVGGPGMSPLAFLLAKRGHVVTGSDLRESEVVQQLRGSGVTVEIGHDASRVQQSDVVVFSTAIPENNVELVEARRRGTAVRHRSGLLGSLCAQLETIGVAGTHGKTTTTALLTHILVSDGRDPSCIVGAEVPGLTVGARHGDGGLFVLESDESDGTLDVLPLTHLVITNVDVDHLDYFGSFDNVQKCFVDAAQRVTGDVVINIDDPGSRPLLQVEHLRGRLVTFGASSDADVHLSRIVSVDRGLALTLTLQGNVEEFVLPLRGQHNAFNCAAAIAMACCRGVDFRVACRAVESFRGVERRFTERGTFNGALLVDDYAHLPAEIEAALSAAESHPRRNGRIVAVFQPNRFHRIATMADSYADCFGRADLIVITDVYASGTPRINGVTGELVVSAVKTAHPELNVVWAPHREDIVVAVSEYLQQGDICVSMGCGDIETFPDDLMDGAR